MSSASRNALIAAAVAIFGISALAAGQQGFFQGRGRWMPEIRPTAVEYDGRFAFTRLRYTGGFRRDPGWAHDYPRADWHFQRILSEISLTPTFVDESNIFTLDDPELSMHPVAYLSEPGAWTMSEAEVAGLRGYLQKGGVPVDVFNGNIIIGLRLPYANLRTHRKLLIVDGLVAFAGGMNIRQGFTTEFAGTAAAHDTHFRVEGPVVEDLFGVAAEDWRFASDEELTGGAWAVTPQAAPHGPTVLMRAVASGPDASLETNQ